MIIVVDLTDYAIVDTYNLLSWFFMFIIYKIQYPQKHYSIKRTQVLKVFKLLEEFPLHSLIM
jgi:hypothetical protein